MKQELKEVLRNSNKRFYDERTKVFMEIVISFRHLQSQMVRQKMEEIFELRTGELVRCMGIDCKLRETEPGLTLAKSYKLLENPRIYVETGNVHAIIENDKGVVRPISFLRISKYDELPEERVA